jgi:thiol-disulfide isomerase/thioredoxin
VLTIPRSYYLPAGLAAMEEVTKHHAANPKVGKLTAWVGYFPPHKKRNPNEAAAAWAMIDAVAKTNPDKAARAQAELARALATKRTYDELAHEHGYDPKSEMAAKLLAFSQTAIVEYQALIKEYGDQPRLAREKGGTIGEFAARELYELEHLTLGRVAPEIECVGVDGKPIKLSDHRGKVVAVVFWASWCGPCMADVPHEREMTERLHGKPFTIVGINGDDKREKAAEVMAKERMTWPSFWNGDGGPEGNVAKAWNVRAWPTVYVLDAKGVIRYKGPRGKLLEEKVNILLDAMDKK